MPYPVDCNDCDCLGCSFVTIPWTEEVDIIFTDNEDDDSVTLNGGNSLAEIQDIVSNFLNSEEVEFDNVYVTGSLSGDVTITICPFDAITSNSETSEWTIIIDGDPQVLLEFEPEDCVEIVV